MKINPIVEKLIFIAFMTLTSHCLKAQSNSSARLPTSLPSDSSLDTQSDSPAESDIEMKSHIFGYINGYWETVQDQPINQGGSNSLNKKTNNPSYDVPNVHLMVSSQAGPFKSFLNIASPGAESVQVNNAWVEGALIENYLKFRIGKLYRPFDLYNEILDATPTYIGIEPPELFDRDHNMLTRTTNAMLSGSVEMGPGRLNYSLTTGNDEKLSDQIPVGTDVHYTVAADFKVGASYYGSNGWAKPLAQTDNAGKVRGQSGGVLPWMERDKFNVFGFYAQYTKNSTIIQLAAYDSHHQGERNLVSLQALCNSTDANLNGRQLSRFGCGGSPNRESKYASKTVYLRLGHTIPLKRWGNVTPYVQFDQFKNEEIIGNLAYGGDNEAGISDDGQFFKYTGGLFFQPFFAVAIKTDYSRHIQTVAGKNTSYGEGRVSFSYFFRFN